MVFVIIFFIIICIVCLKYMAKNWNRTAENQTVQPFQDPKPLTLTEAFSVKGIKADNVMELTSYNNEIKDDYEIIKNCYEIGECVYEEELLIYNGISVDGDKKKIIRINDKEIGYLNEKDSENLQRILSTYKFVCYSVEGHAGKYMKVIRNPDYDKEFDDESEKKWVEWDELKTPKVKLIIHFLKEV